MQTDAVVIESIPAWTAACYVQQRFMRDPAAEISNLDCSARCRQVHKLGGDCYDFVPFAGGRIAVAVGDASGKGFAAALMISNVQSSLRTAALFAGDDTPALLAAVNRQVYASSLANHYASLFYAVYDANACTLRYVNAGHNPPMILRRDGSIEWLETGGAPVGMFPDWTYHEATVQLNTGDLLIAYTDGVVEAPNRCGEEWGVEGLQRAAADNRHRSAHDIVNAIFAAMDAFSRDAHADDATVLVLRGAASQAADPLPAGPAA